MLHGIKGIADYLGIHPCTVRRWVREGLPVRVIRSRRHARGRRYVALASRIDAWVSGED